MNSISVNTSSIPVPLATANTTASNIPLPSTTASINSWGSIHHWGISEPGISSWWTYENRTTHQRREVNDMPYWKLHQIREVNKAPYRGYVVNESEVRKPRNLILARSIGWYLGSPIILYYSEDRFKVFEKTVNKLLKRGVLTEILFMDDSYIYIVSEYRPTFSSPASISFSASQHTT